MEYFVDDKGDCKVPGCFLDHIDGSVFCRRHFPRSASAEEWRRRCADGLAVAANLFRANGDTQKADQVLYGAHTITYTAGMSR